MPVQGFAFAVILLQPVGGIEGEVLFQEHE
jgi:hypothetical protein